jgi:hypothetical protein
MKVRKSDGVIPERYEKGIYVEKQGDPWEILRDSGEIQGNLGEIQ